MSEPRRLQPFELPFEAGPVSGAGDFEWRVLTFPREVSRADARRVVAEHAEYGRWEHARTRLYLGGARRVWLRRKIIRVVRTV